MERATYKPGDVLCDMHDFFRGVPKNLQVLDNFQIRTDFATQMLERVNLGKNPGNKYLVVVDVNSDRLTACYSYDKRYFGVVTLMMKEVEMKM